MMASELSRTLNAIVTEVAPTLRDAGFRTKGKTFNRTVSPGFVHVIHFQLGRVNAPFDTLRVRGLGENPYARFAVNIGVFIDEAWRLETIRFGPEGPPADKKWITEPDCQLRHRLPESPRPRTGLKRLVNRGEPSPTWPLGDPDTARRLISTLITEGFAWFDRYPDRSAVLAELEAAPPSSHEICGINGPDHLLATRMHLASGNTARAQAIFTGYVRHGTFPEGHLGFLATFASEVGLTFPH